MNKRIIAYLTAAVLLISAAGCRSVPVSELTKTTAAETSVTSAQAEPFTPREVPVVWSARMDHIIESAQTYLGINRYTDFDRKENGAYGPAVEETDKDYIFIYPVETLDAMRDDGVLPERDNIGHKIEINYYRTDANGASFKAGERAWLRLSAVRFNDINGDTGKAIEQFRKEKENIDSGLTASGESVKPGFAAETGDKYYVYVAPESECERLYGFDYLYGDDMLVSGILTIDTSNIDGFDEKTLDDIRCFFEALGLKNPLGLDKK